MNVLSQERSGYRRRAQEQSGQELGGSKQHVSSEVEARVPRESSPRDQVKRVRGTTTSEGVDRVW